MRGRSILPPQLATWVLYISIIALRLANAEHLGQPDAHGCFNDEGFLWSRVNAACVQPFDPKHRAEEFADASPAQLAKARSAWENARASWENLHPAELAEQQHMAQELAEQRLGHHVARDKSRMSLPPQSMAWPDLLPLDP